MAIRPSWKGYLKLSLVTCPVLLLPATSESERVRFHTINRKTGNRIRSEYLDAETGKKVADDNQRMGYPVPKGRHPRARDVKGGYVLFTDEELQSVTLESARTIDIDKFVPKSAIEWIWYDTPHFLVPDGKVGEEAYSVIRDAMQESEMAAISRVVLYRRERDVMLDAREDGIILWTLRYGDEVRPEKPYFQGIPAKISASKKLDLVTRLIAKHTESWTPTMVKDPVQQKIRQIIAAKGKKHPAKQAPKEDAAKDAGKGAVSIMDALKRSLEGTKRPAPGGRGRTTRKAARRA